MPSVKQHGEEATAYGIAPSIPTLMSENPDWRFRMVGSQKIIA
jgi:hypothetical protein